MASKGDGEVAWATSHPVAPATHPTATNEQGWGTGLIQTEPEYDRSPSLNNTTAPLI